MSKKTPASARIKDPSPSHTPKEHEHHSEHGTTLLSSPRSVEACKRQGFDPHKLVFWTKLEMQKVWGDLPEDVFEFWYWKHEEKWKHNLKLVAEERHRIISEHKRNPKEKELQEVMWKEKEKLEKAKEKHWKEIEAYLEF